ncbi:hypothetical protein DPMN_048310 [Dreissena polymorpha]|uniref:Uncharacterized protein n=1 Tax=Dreissena polymorpha TaxID=45954 RepID=A0A9D4DAK3_DREPO|nr:hypothetical protein DPMN_048310 [Dreissena polymorpha]
MQNVLLLQVTHHYKAIGAKEIYLLTGRNTTHVDKKRFIPIHDVVHKLTEDHMKILLTVYCITSCDTTSGFHGKGKKEVFNLFMKYAKTFQNLHDIGEQLNLQKLQKDACEKFVALLYGNENLTLN